MEEWKEEIDILLEEFIKQYHLRDIEQIYKSPKPVTDYFSLTVSFCNLLNVFPSRKITASIVRKLELAVQIVQVELAGLYDQLGHFKPHIKVLLSCLPLMAPFVKTKVPEEESIGKIITMVGVVIRVGPLKTSERFKIYECCVCGNKQKMAADEWQGGFISRPLQCTGLIEDGDRKCPSVKHKAVQPANTNEYEDIQEIRVQEIVEQVGRVPRSLLVVLKNVLVDCGRVGQRLAVTGQLIARWKPKTNNSVDLALIATATEDLEPKRSRTRMIHPQFIPTVQDLIQSFCSHIYGLELVKLSILIAMVSCCGQSLRSTANSLRKNIHILLVGDPGTAKSQLLRAAAALVPRSIVTTGSGSSTAGLTVAAVKEGTNASTSSSSASNEWSLEAGALALADGSLCCIDEFLALRNTDRAAIHEAMEQQCISVAKAGISCRVPARCSVIAACNGGGPGSEGRPSAKAREEYEVDENGGFITGNTALASPLLSRFDLILALNNNLGSPDRDWEERCCHAILQGKMKSRTFEPPLSDEKLKAWITRPQNIPIQLTRAAQRILSAYYERQRQADFRDAARTTTRLLESLMRLCGSHAWLRGQDQWATLLDASWAVWLMDASLPSQMLCANKRPHLLRDSLPDGQVVISLVSQRLSLVEAILAEMDAQDTAESKNSKTIFKISSPILDFASSQAAL